MSEDEKNRSRQEEDEKHERASDISGTVTEQDKPIKKVRLFFSRRVWIAIITFIALTAIGGIIEMSVQTPISNYIDKIVGPRMRTLKRQLGAGNFEFVYRTIKPKFYEEPYDKRYQNLYIESSEGLLHDLIEEYEWEKAASFIQEAVEGMPISKEHRTKLRRVYMSVQAERFKQFKNEATGSDAGRRLNEMWKEVKMLALKEEDDPIIQFEAGRALAELDWVGDRYNKNSIIYFQKALKLNSKMKDKEIIYVVLDQALESSPDYAIVKKSRAIIEKYYIEGYLDRLRGLLKPYPFKDNQDIEKSEKWDKRINAFLILLSAKKAAPADKFRFHLMTVAHFRWSNELNLKLLKKSKLYFSSLEKSGKFNEARKKAKLPDIVPASVFSLSSSSDKFKETWPLVSGMLAPIFEGYCHKRLFSEGDADVSEHCESLLRKIGKLTPEEIDKLNRLRGE